MVKPLLSMHSRDGAPSPFESRFDGADAGRGATLMNQVPTPAFNAAADQSNNGLRPAWRPGARALLLARLSIFASVLVVLAVSPFATRALPHMSAFQPAYEGWSVLCACMMAILFFSQFSIVRSGGLLILACGCLFTALAALAGLVTNTGGITPTGLVGVGAQTSVWFFIFWTAGFPISVILYTRFPGAQGLAFGYDSRNRSLSGRRTLTVGLCCLLAVGLGLVVLTRMATGHLPPMLGMLGFTPFAKFCATLIVGAAVTALVEVARRKPHTRLDGWLTMGLIAWLFNLVLSGILSHAQYDLAWYAGRAYGAVGSGLLLVALALENANQHRRVFEMHNALLASNEALDHLSRHDALTGLPNRRYFDAHLHQQSAIMRRHRRSLAIIIFDVDDFKAFNDRFGHQAGDECLARIGQALQSCCRRPADLAARYGGEEFAFILPETDLTSAMRVAGMALKAVEDLNIAQAPGSLRPVITISGGVAVQDDRDNFVPATVIALADSALFQSKRRGRNRITAHNPDRPVSQPPLLHAV